MPLVRLDLDGQRRDASEPFLPTSDTLSHSTVATLIRRTSWCLAAIGAFATLAWARPAAAQGRWDLTIGPYTNPADSSDLTGMVYSFNRWPGEEKTIQHGVRIVFNWGNETSVRTQGPTGSHYWDERRTGASAAGVSIPIRIGPVGWPVRPYLLGEPGGALYRSIDRTRRTHETTGNLGVFDRSKWLIGPTMLMGGGVSIPGRGRLPHLHARAGYKVGWMFGQEGQGISGNGWWQTWEVAASASFVY